MTDPTRLAAFREALARRGLTGFVVPLTDPHMSEYVADAFQRLAWLTGFTGSAGIAVILSEEAALFVDGRYTLQAGDQVDARCFALQPIEQVKPKDWLSERLGPADRLGYDPALHSSGWVSEMAAVAQSAGAALVAEADNPIDAVWTDRPPLPAAPVTVQPDALAGESSAEKRARYAAALKAAGADAGLVTMTDAIAWLFNIRGADVPHNPVALAYAIVEADGGAELFIDEAKLDAELRSHLGREVAIRPYDQVADALRARTGQALLMDPASANAALFAIAEQAEVRPVRQDDPVARMKAMKNATELAGMKSAHERDALAVVRFLHWLAEEAPKGQLDELTAADRLLALRQEDPAFRETSFDTISGAGPNGAIVHYRVTDESNRRLEPATLYLVDSGGQYQDGTTDITRTIAVGPPTDAMRRHYTLVLKGYIALATTRFPRGTTGHQLDAIARRPLWAAGLDYGHGTGHGVGCYLNVHEGPQRIAKQVNAVALEPGMIVSNEPGYYRTGQYGIRLENLEQVVSLDGPFDQPMLGFEPLTLAPYERELIDIALLSADEIAWVDGYQARVAKTLAHRLPAETADWLTARCAPLR